MVSFFILITENTNTCPKTAKGLKKTIKVKVKTIIIIIIVTLPAARESVKNKIKTVKTTIIIITQIIFGRPNK